MSFPKKNKAAAAYSNDNAVELVRGGKNYFDRLHAMIDSATSTIHLHTYIWEADETGNKVADALIAAAQRQIEVCVVADGFASQSLPKSFLARLQAGGVHFRFFEPVFKSRNFYFGRRMHHKIIVVDTIFGMTGGINISDRYNDMPGQPAWLDFAVYVSGTAAIELCTVCKKTWEGYQPITKTPPCKPGQSSTGYAFGKIPVRVRQNDWVERKNQISKSYRELLSGAHKEVIILCSYFLPGSVMRQNIKRAVRHGVSVKVVMAGFSDVSIAKNAERFMYDWLLRNKVEIYEYQDNVLHGKVAICDDEWVTIGSYNVNDISAYATLELNLDIKDAGFASHTANTVRQIISSNCIQVTEANHRKSKNIFKQFMLWCSYKFFRLSLFLFTFYFKQRG